MKRNFAKLSSLILLLSGFFLIINCSSYNQMIKEKIPAAGFESMEWQENFGPFYNFSITATGRSVGGNELTVEKITINRVTGTTSGHFMIEGYHRTLPAKVTP